MACQRKEIRVSMSVFTMILDLACNNGYAVACALSTKYKKKINFSEFKRRVADQLSRPWSLRKKDGRAQGQQVGAPSTITNENDANDLRLHVLTNNQERNSGKGLKDGKCYLCDVLGTEKTMRETMSSKMGCFQCGQCFHLQCFNMMHHRQFNTEEFNVELNSAISLSKKKRKAKTETVADPASYGGGH
jgi:hypothetical protein